MKPLQFHTKRHDAHASFTFSAGIIHCGGIREYFEDQKREGLDFEWLEGDGWLRHDWAVRGAPAAVQAIQGGLKQIQSRVNK